MRLTTLVTAVATLASISSITPAIAQTPAANTAAVALVTAAKGREFTLAVGSDDGVFPGAIYGVLRDNQVRARLRVTQVRQMESTATLFGEEEGFIVAVGDEVRFLLQEEAPAPAPTPRPVATATPIPVAAPAPAGVAVPPVLPPTGSTVAPAGSTPGTGNQPVQPVATGSGSDATARATISAIDGSTVTINAGAAQGVRTATNAPIMRGGNVIGLLRVQTTSTSSSTGVVVWQDENAGPIAPGDAVSILVAPSEVPDSTGVVEVTETVKDTTPGAPIRFETGASNITVPRADRTYEYLASLAADGLITRYPAHVFHDEGTRRHRTAEDLTFTRAQIAGLIREAMTNADGEEMSGKRRAALSALSREYSRDLQKLGVAPAEIAALSNINGFAVGISGQTRVSIVAGDTNNVVLPFSERQGGLRTRSGFDSRTNIFGQINNNLSFFGTLDAGSDAGRNTNDRRFQLRKGLVSYNASRLLRGLTIEAGRDEPWFGPGHFGTLLLSDVAGPLNMIRTTFKRGSYRQEGLYAPLGSGIGGASRSLYAHNLQVQIGSHTRIGIAETALLPRDGFDPLMFAAAMTGFPLVMTERLRDRDTAADNANLLVEAYIENSIARGIKVYGEFLVDDIGVSESNLVRNRIGTLLGAHLYTPRDPAKLGLYAEYANLQGRTYLGLVGINNGDYFYRGQPLGYPVAPLQGGGAGGAESLRFEGYWSPTPRLRLNGGIEFADLRSEDPNFSRQQTLRLRAAYDLSRTITLVARAQRVATSRPNFILGEPRRQQNMFQLEVARAF